MAPGARATGKPEIRRDPGKEGYTLCREWRPGRLEWDCSLNHTRGRLKKEDAGGECVISHIPLGRTRDTAGGKRVRWQE